MTPHCTQTTRHFGGYVTYEETSPKRHRLVQQELATPALRRALQTFSPCSSLFHSNFNLPLLGGSEANLKVIVSLLFLGFSLAEHLLQLFAAHAPSTNKPICSGDSAALKTRPEEVGQSLTQPSRDRPIYLIDVRAERPMIHRTFQESLFPGR